MHPSATPYNHYLCLLMTNLTDEQRTLLKQQLKDVCLTVLADRIRTAEQAMTDAQEAAKGEGKSSAGDKYETSRAMAHLNSEMNARQLQEAKHELAELQLLNPSARYSHVTTGAVVVCQEQTYFIALGLGPTVVNEQKITFLSPQAPIASMLHHKRASDSVVFNNKLVEIIEVF